MNDNKAWEYRVVRQPSKDGNDGYWYSIQEVYYDDETGEPMAQTIDLQVEGHTVTEMRNQLERMLKSLDEPPVDESDITSMPPIETKIPLPAGTDYHGDGRYYSKWSRKEETDDKDV